MKKPPGFTELGRPVTAARPLPREKALDTEAHEVAGREPVAVIVCHGMGQQVPFETIDIVARALRCASLSYASEPPGREGKVVTRIVDLGTGRPVGRAELEVRDRDGRERPVHVYEAYWAPLTAGKVSLSAIASFLVGAGVNGLRNIGEPFWRWMFGDWQAFGHAWKPFAQLLFALLCFASLAVMNTTIVVVVASHAIGKGSVWPDAELMTSITADLAVFAIPALVTAVALLVAYMRHQHAADYDRDWKARKLTGTLGPSLLTALIWLTLWLALVSGVLLAWDLAATRVSLPDPWRMLCDCSSLACAYRSSVGGWAWAIWPLVVVVSLFARKFMIEYVGDVVAYVDAHKVSEFAELRLRIQTIAHDIGKAVYQWRQADGSAFEYARVVVVGHSLGSVVAYDMLNRLLLEDLWLTDAQKDDLGVKARTAGVLTFGSPLDKTAFIFRGQKLVVAAVREALAAGVQPLIAHPSFREGLRWINLWSRKDWISGPLNYYDVPSARHDDAPEPPWAVQNIEDAYARVPLLAHTMYWRGPAFADHLLRLIFR